MLSILVALVVPDARLATGASEGEVLYGEVCASCHGLDGRGRADTEGFEVALPDFTDCSFTTREPLADWSLVYKAIRLRGHVALAGGVEVQIGGRRPFDYRIVGFLLWEYADGGLWW